MNLTQPLRMCLFGAPLDTGNRGVEALGRSVLSGVARFAPSSSVTVFDNGWGRRAGQPTGEPIDVELCGVRRSRRYYRRESWWNVRVSQRLGGLGNPVAQRLRAADAVLDISGGDSFSDIYGPIRLRTVLEPKWATLRANRPLVLLPQTYGPFTEPGARDLARKVLRPAALAYSRDADSHAVLLDLLGEAADQARHREGVDVAFALVPREATHKLPVALQEPLQATSRPRPLVGVNVSGLLWNTPASGDPFRLRLDYRATVQGLVRSLLEAEVDVLLVPHVKDVALRRESDAGAADAVREGIARPDRERVHFAPDDLDADEVKWLISRCDWFCGTRMHSTIAGLSSLVPTAAIAYSMKTQGVFATCGVADEVVDARSVGTAEGVEQLMDAFRRRDSVRRQLGQTVSPVVARASAQLAEVCEWVRSQPAAAATVRDTA